MTRFAILASAASAAALLTAAPAAADYTIDEDPAFPSVVYINFDADTMPKVIMAPSGGDLSVIQGRQIEQQSNVDVPAGETDPNSPDLQNSDTAASADSDNSDNSDNADDNGDEDQTASTTPLDQRIEDRVNEVMNDQQKVEDILIDLEIENRLQEEADRLAN